MSYEPKKILKCAPNARDLGGIETADGRRLRSGRLIRSGKLSNPETEDIKYLESIELKTVIDFRTIQEQIEKPDMKLPGVEYISCPIFEGKTEGITREKPETEDEEARRTVAMARHLMPRCPDGKAQMRSLYALLVTDAHAIEYYKKFFDILLAHENGALLYHCMMGKDRVGTGTSLLLHALGVCREAVISDYMITLERCAPGTKRLLENCRRYTESEEELKFIYELDSVDESFICAGLDAIDNNFGGMDEFLRNQMCLTDEKRERLKALYLE